MKIINIRNVPIKHKMILIIMLITTIALSFACLVFVIYDEINFKKKIAEQLQSVAEIIGENNTAAITFMDADAAKGSLNSLKVNKNIIVACIYLKNGDLFATYVRDEMKGKISFPTAPKKGLFFTKDYLELFQNIKLNGESTGLIYIKSDLKELYSSIKDFLKVAIAVLLSSLIIAFLISSKLQHIISKPILKLAETAKYVSMKKDYSIRMCTKGTDEIGKLFICFNDMLSQIEKQNTELLNAKEIAEHSRKVKEQFLANMSHEIRTPMNAIIGMADILQEEDLPIEQKECVDAIKLSADNLLTIINDILDFSKIESGKITFENLPFKLEEVIEGIVQTLHFTASKKSLVLTYSISNEIPKVIIGDTTRLRQILLNLASNSIKFTEKGSVKIDIQLNDQKDDFYTIQFKVTDTGVGISNDKLSGIFDSFTQASSETTRKYGGTGLGLTIAKQLIELQGGTISVNSEINNGSCFYFTLTFKKSNLQNIEVKTEDKSSSYSELQDLKILLAEDNIMNQMLAKKIFKKWKCKLDIADNGRIAVDKLSKADYDIILMDMQMPEMDGYEATKYIRNNMSLPKSKTAIIAMTAHALVGEAEKCITLGMDDYISKPFNQRTLYEKIKQLTKKDTNIGSSQESTFVITTENSDSASQSYTDLTYLKELSEGSNEFVLEMINGFLEQTPEMLEKMARYLNEKKWPELRGVAHKMKPSIDFMGIHSVKDTVNAVEKYAGEQINFELLPDMVASIIQACSVAIIELREKIKN
ncbi:MAG: hypothetical protein A3F72_02680 [Bacteroidetes bacterium RIFCSPLOWO2_12_FULL_35_15]|nr:MAG: hypothetical protein A3F72_02680 [Bacteroidetes bacterium RIFCSPLOWO2_12_FULL_35_15]